MPEDHSVTIVGSGPSGLAAALELRRKGVPDVVVLEREAEAGGMPRFCDHTGYGLRDMHALHTGPGYAAAYRRLASAAGIEVRVETTVTGWGGPLTLEVTGPSGPRQIAAEAVLLATGCRERPRSARLVHGKRPQGVYTTGSLQRFITECHQPVGRRAVVVGAETVSMSALLTLRQAGMAVVALVTEHPEHQVPALYLPGKWYLADLARVPLLTRTVVSRILGERRVEAVEMTQLDSGQVTSLPCDSVIFTGDWIPEHELARLHDLEIDPAARGPRVDSGLRTSQPGIFAAGNLLRGAAAADLAALEGRAAGGHIASYLANGHWPERRPSIAAGDGVAWISPNAIGQAGDRPPLGTLVFQAHTFFRRAQAAVYQGDRLLYSHNFGRVIPNQPLRLDGGWLPAVDIGGPDVRFVLQPGG
jgi:thioredoxin reductase